jgi:7-cyano-7-deazaguanine synthase
MGRSALKDRGPKKAIVLLSGGLDSATAAAVAKDQGYELYGLTVSYGQRHIKEVAAAKAIGKALGLRDHFFSEIVLGKDGSALLDEESAVPQDRKDDQIRSGEIPSTYVPARNIILLSIAAYWAEVVGAEAIFTGFNVIDYSGYPDCSKEFVAQFERTLKVGTKAGREGRPPKVIAPLLALDKAGIIKLGTRLKVPYNLTWSCYKGGKKACGRCDSCRLRLKGFKEVGMVDPIDYDSPT